MATLAENNGYAVLTGELSICHTADDLKNWKGNLGKSGFLPEKQARLDLWIRDHSYVDLHRMLHGPGSLHVVVVAGEASTTTWAGALTTASPARPAQSWRCVRKLAARRHTRIGVVTTHH